MSQIQEMCRICLHLKLEPDDTAAITDDEFQAKIKTVFSFEVNADFLYQFKLNSMKIFDTASSR